MASYGLVNNNASVVWKNKHKRHGQDINTAQGEAMCYMWLKTIPECYF